MLTRLEKMEDRLSKKYNSLSLSGQKSFELDDGTIIQLTGLIPFNSIVVEYANNIKEARENMFEDGDLFEMQLSEDEMLDKIIAEIEN